MEEVKVSTPSLVIQVTHMPDDGIKLIGEVPFRELDIKSDERFELIEPLHFKLCLNSARQDVVLTGSLETHVLAICDRCTEQGTLELKVDNICHRYKNILGEPIDLTEDIREDILLAFPQTYHCREDCKGLCPKCGKNLNEGPCSCKTEPDAFQEEQDPWKALGNLHLE